MSLNRRRASHQRQVGIIESFLEDCCPAVPEPRHGALKKLGERVAFWQARLFLADWNLHYRFVQHLEGWSARITISTDLVMGLVEMTATVPEDEWDWVIVHELVHLFLFPLSQFTNQLVDDLGTAQQGLAEPLLERLEETAVNRITQAILAKKWPLKELG